MMYFAQLTESYLSVVDNILGIDINVLTQSQAVSKTSARYEFTFYYFLYLHGNYFYASFVIGF